ncbi:MAG: cell division topological specificity factor MinE [Cyanobacteriota bacterium]|nr:cell division topological specificity factor MinE [Cyanobacteriota bacterium]
MSDNIFAEIYSRLLGLFGQNTKDESKNTAVNRLRLVLMQDRTNLTPEIMNKMRTELIEVLSRYVVLDKDALDLNIGQEGEQMALMLSIPVVRAKNEEEIEQALKEEEEAKKIAKEIEEKDKEAQEADKESDDKDEEKQDENDEDKDEETSEKELETSEKSEKEIEDLEPSTEEPAEPVIEITEEPSTEEPAEPVIEITEEPATEEPAELVIEIKEEPATEKPTDSPSKKSSKKQ